MVSKKASVKEGIEPDTIKGMAPIREKLTQLNETARKPSFADSSEGMGIKRFIIIPSMVSPADVKI